MQRPQVLFNHEPFLLAATCQETFEWGSSAMPSHVQHQTTKQHATSSGADGNSSNHHQPATAAESSPDAPTTAAAAGVLQREVFSKSGGGGGGGAAGRRRFIWSRLGRSRPAESPAECAVCLEELRAGDVLVHLPCAHRFHWACAVPWVQAASRCPVCRAHVHLAASG
ncbi:hypothetical protein ACP70R_049935 [Stipagrostis hirtigluma subsp. patula]